MPFSGAKSNYYMNMVTTTLKQLEWLYDVHTNKEMYGFDMTPNVFLWIKILNEILVKETIQQNFSFLAFVLSESIYIS